MKILQTNYVVKKEADLCGSYEAEKCEYELYRGKSGKYWLVAKQPNAADNIYVASKDGKARGSAGQVLAFSLGAGNSITLQGPRHGNFFAFSDDTGIDLSGKHLTQGLVALHYHMHNGHDVFIDIVYIDDKPVVGELNRIEKIAQTIADDNDCTVSYYSRSIGGSTFSLARPKSKKGKE